MFKNFDLADLVALILLGILLNILFGPPAPSSESRHTAVADSLVAVNKELAKSILAKDSLIYRLDSQNSAHIATIQVLRTELRSRNYRPRRQQLDTLSINLDTVPAYVRQWLGK